MSRRLMGKRGWGVMIVLAIVVGVGGVWFLRRDKGQVDTYSLTLTAGNAKGQRHQLAELLASEAAGHGLRVTVQGTEGSEQALDEVNAGRLDTALVQGGLSLKGRQHIRQVACLHIEPLHLLVKPDLAQAVSRDLGELKGKDINLSTPGSGTHHLARAVLDFAGLRPGRDQGTGDYAARDESYDDLLARAAEVEAARREFRTGRASEQEAEQTAARVIGGMPDAVFMVSSLPSPVAQALVRSCGYRLVPLPFGEAIAVEALGEQVAAGGGPSAAPSVGVNKGYIYPTAIPAYVYSVQPAVPAEQVPTVGTRLLLVAHEDVSPAALERMVPVLFKTRFANVAKPPLDPVLLDLPTEAPPHEGTLRYLRRTKPLVGGEVLDMAETAATVLTVLGAAGGGLVFLAGAWRRYRQQRWARQLRTYIHRVEELRDAARRVEESDRHDAVTVRELRGQRAQLDQIKAEAYQQPVEGNEGGEALLDFLLSEVRDTRNYLTTLILRERDLKREREGQAV